jgi:hypothetical protein
MSYKSQSTEPVADGQYPVFFCNLPDKHKVKADKLKAKVEAKKVKDAS